ncbi:MAM and LDL-receptor class A domain-containing protein 1-like [Ochlerotatus camptorhynchus]|uniref:MAM and LDL-receptor class A domain-containing protein 1-like n=1 Tax=Ochlerotatus camptorhynchus TaxID=644619 RepID=UPI0031D14B4F
MITKRLSHMFIVVVFLAVVEMYSATKYSENRYAPLVRNSYSNICPKPELLNGMIRIRLRGKFLRFDCNTNFTLVGAKYILCKSGRWNSPAPICVKPGCSDLPPVANGFIFYENEKAAATLFCDSSYKTFGPMYSYCNGSDWDRTIGSCRSSGLTVERSCDFETEDFCGWENTDIGSVEWQRSSGVVSRRLLKTGPKHDHTTGQPLNGHFMMIDSSQQDTKATAHLISPIYSSNYSTKACFRFFYHMFGDVGTLSVYVKPLSLELGNMLKQGAQFTISGNQGNAWNEGYFDLQKQTESFQIIIQASLGMRFKSDTAIDDVALLNGSDCLSNGTVLVPITESDADIFKIDSCINRCGLHMHSIDEDASNLIQCGCTSDCDADNNLCCPDYAEVCLFDESNGTEEDMITLSKEKLQCFH